MPVEFLADEQVAVYGRFAASPSAAELSRLCLLDDADRSLVARHRGAASRLGFALQLVTVRSVGAFLDDPRCDVTRYAAVWPTGEGRGDVPGPSATQPGTGKTSMRRC